MGEDGQWGRQSPPALLPGCCVLAHAVSLARGCLRANRNIFLMNIILKLLRMYGVFLFFFSLLIFLRIFVITQPALFLPRKEGIKTRVSHLLLDCTNPFL